MRILGLIVEYNPFHNGHIYHIQKAKSLAQFDYTIAIMSSSFVQRGEPAIIDKWKRSQLAIPSLETITRFFRLNLKSKF